MEFVHVPVLCSETIDSLKVRPDGVYVDGTLGGAGHAGVVASMLGNDGRLIGFDQDAEAIEAASRRLEKYGSRVSIVHDNFENIPRYLSDRGLMADGILLDLGVSSHQLDDADRGFSYRFDAPLDMRMDRDNPVSAADIVNTYSKEELCRIIREYGEERFALSIASCIVKAREEKPIMTTGQLVEVIRMGMPKKAQVTGGHPAKRTFQAIRIACNRELEVLENSIDGLIDSLAPAGRLAIITFHSLEDRIVKNAFKRNENPCTCPPDFPVCVCGKVSKGHVEGRKPIAANEHEIEINPRSKSAKLRVFEKRKGGE